MARAHALHFIAVLLGITGPGCVSVSVCPMGEIVEGDRCVPIDAGADAGGPSDAGDAPTPDVPTDGSTADGGLDACIVQSFFADLDEDGHGDPGAEMMACTAPDGFVASDDDCDDDDEVRHGGASELCDGIDNDCDEPEIDEDFDCVQGASVACTTSCGSTGTGDCSSTCTLPAVDDCAPPAESCVSDASVDDDCDGQIDEGLQTIGAPTDLGGSADRVIVVATTDGFVALMDRASGVVAQRFDAEGALSGTAVDLTTSAVTELDAYSTGSQIVVAWNGGTDFTGAVLNADLSIATSSRSIAPRPDFSGTFRVVADGSNVLLVFYDGGDGTIRAVRRSFPALSGSSAAFDVATDGRDDLSATVDASGNRAYVAYRADSGQIRIIRLLTSGSVEGTSSAVTTGTNTKRAPAVFFSAGGGRRRLGVAWHDDGAASDAFRFASYSVALDGTLGTVLTADLSAMAPPTAPLLPVALTWSGGRFIAMMLDAGVPDTDSFFRVVEVTEPPTGPLTTRGSMVVSVASHNAVSLAGGASGGAILGTSRAAGSTRIYRFGCP